jgi:L-rhamnose mutarotase
MANKIKIASKMQLNEGQAAEYKKRHNPIWPELAALLKDYGISDYSIFLDNETNTLFAVLSAEVPEKLETLKTEELMKKWWTYMRDIMQTNEDHSPLSIPLEEVFYLL